MCVCVCVRESVFMRAFVCLYVCVCVSFNMSVCDQFLSLFFFSLSLCISIVPGLLHILSPELRVHDSLEQSSLV